MKCDSCGNSSDFAVRKKFVACDYCGTIIESNAADSSIEKTDTVAFVEDINSKSIALVLPIFHEWSKNHNSIQIAPGLSQKKINKFLSSWEDLTWFKDTSANYSGENVNGVEPEKLGIFAQVDCTIFGSAKESVVITWGGIAFKEIGENPDYVNWSDFHSKPTTSVGIISPVLKVGQANISFSGSDVTGKMLPELISILNSMCK